MSETTLEVKIEAILFYKNEPLSVKKLTELTGSSVEEVREAMERLGEALHGRGIALIKNGEEVSLSTSSSVSEIISDISKKELSENIGKAGLETLAIVLYNGPVSRREIDYIRGVNSTFILRSLQSRGLVEKVNNPKDQRLPLYKGSTALLAHLGVTNVGSLPDFDKLKTDINNIMQSVAATEE